MARPQKLGIDYFSMDSEKDIKIKLLKGKYGVLGFGMYIELLQWIYSQGFFTKWDDDNMLLFLAETGLMEAETKEMLSFMLEKGLFDSKLYNKYGILTSRGIQKRYVEGTRRRAIMEIPKEYWLIEDYEHLDIKLMFTISTEKYTETTSNDTESTQSKVKETILNYITDKHIKQFGKQVVDEFVEYRSEEDKKGKQKWEKEKTWSLESRLRRWKRNKDTNFGKIKVLDYTDMAIFDGEIKKDYQGLKAKVGKEKFFELKSKWIERASLNNKL